jgi:hypothetical protein
MKTGSVRRFLHKFQDVMVPHKDTTHRSENKFRRTEWLLVENIKLKCRMFTEKKLNETGASPGHSTQKSLRYLA